MSISVQADVMDPRTDVKTTTNTFEFVFLCQHRRDEEMPKVTQKRIPTVVLLVVPLLACADRCSLTRISAVACFSISPLHRGHTGTKELRRGDGVSGCAQVGHRHVQMLALLKPGLTMIGPSHPCYLE